MSDYHKPILLEKVIDLLQVKKGKKYIDATVGGAGHTSEMLKRGATVLAIDMDDEAIDYVAKNYNLYITNQKLILEKGNFKNIDKIAHLKKMNDFAGILFDLGVSSHQIDTPKRGFSFLKNGPLDMRMDKNASLSAEYLVNVLEKGELYDIFNKLGQESRAFAISSSIASARRIKAIQTTDELTSVIARAYGFKGEISDFNKNKISQKVFQALRIVVNNELENLKVALPKALELLEKNGRIAVISFHSLEDKIVKESFIAFEKQNMGKIITKKPLIANDLEIKDNSRAKSAKLRVFEKN